MTQQINNVLYDRYLEEIHNQLMKKCDLYNKVDLTYFLKGSNLKPQKLNFLPEEYLLSFQKNPIFIMMH